MSDAFNERRRGLLRGLAAGGLVLAIGPMGGCEKIKSRVKGLLSGPDGPSTWLHIASDGIVTITAARSEMGQGVRTSLPMIVADELEADWARVRIQQATGDPRYGSQNTDNSISVRAFFQPMRRIGATARMMLEAAAAEVWKVPVGECRAANHNVVHALSGRSLSYGELADHAVEQRVPDEPRLKARDEFRYIGKSMPGIDVVDITHGRAVYGADVVLPGMRFASVERCPVVGGTLNSVDTAAALAMPGVNAVVEISAASSPAGFAPGAGVAIVADSSWTAMRARTKLGIKWDGGVNASFDSATHMRELREAVEREGEVVSERGDAVSMLATAANVVRATYESPLLAHAAMEPLACVADVTSSGCVVWAPVQSPQRTRDEIARFLGINPEDVVVNVTLLGGAFGRKAKPDFVIEAVDISRQTRTPIQLTWTREDDMRHDYYHANCAQHYAAALDDSGMPVAWLQRTAFPSLRSAFESDRTMATAGELGQGFTRLPFRVPNLRCENVAAAAHLRIGWLRSVCHIFHSFGVNSFVDELAVAAGKDPIDYHLALLGDPQVIELSEGERRNPIKFDTGRLANLIRFLRSSYDWERPLAEGVGRGFAAHGSFYSYTAALVELSLNDVGRPRVRRVEIAIDCGLIVNPDTVRAQLEGAAVFGLSLALHGRITASNGAVEQGNFNDYPILRLRETPEIVVHLMDSNAPPTGVGEPGVPPIAPAVCNAIYAVTGQRVRDLPVGTVQAESVVSSVARQS